MPKIADEAKRATICWPDGTLRKRVIESAERNRRSLTRELLCLIEQGLDAQRREQARRERDRA